MEDTWVQIREGIKASAGEEINKYGFYKHTRINPGLIRELTLGNKRKHTKLLWPQYPNDCR